MCVCSYSSVNISVTEFGQTMFNWAAPPFFISFCHAALSKAVLSRVTWKDLCLSRSSATQHPVFCSHLWNVLTNPSKSDTQALPTALSLLKWIAQMWWDCQTSASLRTTVLCSLTRAEDQQGAPFGGAPALHFPLDFPPLWFTAETQLQRALVGEIQMNFTVFLWHWSFQLSLFRVITWPLVKTASQSLPWQCYRCSEKLTLTLGVLWKVIWISDAFWHKHCAPANAFTQTPPDRE